MDKLLVGLLTVFVVAILGCASPAKTAAVSPNLLQGSQRTPATSYQRAEPSPELVADKNKEIVCATWLRKLCVVAMYMDKHYMGEFDGEALVEKLIPVMFKGLDRHSAYLGINSDRSEAKQGKQRKRKRQPSNKRSFSGIGIEVDPAYGEKNGLRVTQVYENSPAEKAGISLGDIITHANGRPIPEEALENTLGLLKREHKKSITLKIWRLCRGKTYHVTLERAEIKYSRVISRPLGERIAYVRVRDFEFGASKLFLNAIRDLKRAGPLQGLIIDLRGNPGGWFGEVKKIMGRLLPGERLSHQKRGKDGIIWRVKLAEGARDELSGAPIVILINRGSKSASEVMAGALQDHQRATIMGERSYGKGTVQSLIALDKRSAFLMTFYHYFTPQGHPVNGVGITPDIAVSEVGAQCGVDNQLEAAHEYLNNVLGRLFSQRAS